MKNVFSAFILLSSASALAAAPTVSDVTVVQDDASRKVTVSYVLADGPAFVTAELLTNGVPAGVSLGAVTGDLNTTVAAGTRSFVWKAYRDWKGNKGEVSVRVKAMPRGQMPDYLVIDLLNPNSFAYYATSNDVPGGVLDMVYKTDKLVLRRIPARGVTWRMGQPNGYELCAGSSTKTDVTYESTLRDNETGHKVALTEDYYMGIFEFTQRQYYNLTKLTPSDYKKGDSSTHYEGSKAWPVEQVSYNTLRGTSTEAWKGWPQDGHQVADGSFLRTIRDFTGIESLDLPTEAQWEYACRAGTKTSLNSGVNFTATMTGSGDPEFAKVGWSQYNTAYDDRSGKTPHDVGLLNPNAWGLYDMHGNVHEICLDWMSRGDDYRATFAPGWTFGETTIDPLGPTNGTCRVVRGGDWFYAGSWARSATRAIDYPPDRESYHYGFRLVCAATAE